jgi:serine protease AprX
VGADILNTSLGSNVFDNPAQNHTFADLDGKTVPMSIAATMAARKGMFVLNAAGNGGGSSWFKIGIPADADSICTVGAIDSTNNVASFSSTGPTADGRIKPDLVARGAGSWISYPSGACGQQYGTSFSTPILAGAVACYWQAHKTWNNIKILDTLRKTASNSATPDNQRGWGTPNMCAIPAGVKEFQAEDYSFSIWPNPVTAYLTIRSEMIAPKAINIELYNSLGAAVQSLVLPANKQEQQVDMSLFAPGIYFIKLSGPPGYSVKKIVKQ